MAKFTLADKVEVEEGSTVFNGATATLAERKLKGAYSTFTSQSHSVTLLDDKGKESMGMLGELYSTREAAAQAKVDALFASITRSENQIKNWRQQIAKYLKFLPEKK